LFNYYPKAKGFYFKIINKQFKFFRLKFRRSVIAADKIRRIVGGFGQMLHGVQLSPVNGR